MRKTERSAVSVLAGWMRQIIRERRLPLGLVDVETAGPDPKYPDLLLYETPRGRSVLAVGEFRRPHYNVFDEEELKTPAHRKAVRRRAPFFFTSNFRRLVWFSTERVNRMLPEAEQIVNVYDLSPLDDLDLLEETRFQTAVQRALERLLEDLVAVHFDRRPEPRLPLDQMLVAGLRDIIDALAPCYQNVIAERSRADRAFERRLARWFADQQWTYRRDEADYKRAARQAAYLLSNKMLFYHVLHAKRPRDLDPLDIPAGITRGGILRTTLEGFFQDVIRTIDYETIYSTDFLDELTFPSDREVVRLVRALNSLLARYDVAHLKFDILGPIFEQLIPPEDRHVLGQYFTQSDVVDLILGFAVRHEDDLVLDPACGAGTFLVRGYHRKKLLNPRASHEQLLSTLWGVDIAKFPAHLTMINLAINDLSVEENYPRILQKDFFELAPDRRDGPMVKVARFSGAEESMAFPRSLDAIVGNPPYTRQEEIDEIAGAGGYKRRLVKRALHGVRGAEGLTDRAGIHAYFFIHGSKLLRRGGRFGFVVSDTWLDADFGTGLKRFLRETFCIQAVIASKIERWFPDAAVNTCIVLLEREPNSSQRDRNTVHFVQLKRPLSELIAGARGDGKERGRWAAVRALLELALSHEAIYENDALRVVPVRQGKLDPKNKWGLFLRAPSVLFRALEKTPVRLGNLAEVRRGWTTGADPWFYVRQATIAKRDELAVRARGLGLRGRPVGLRLAESGDGSRWPVEERFLVPVLRNPAHYRSIRIREAQVEDLAVLIPQQPKTGLKGTLLRHYVNHGERTSYDMGKRRQMVPARTQTCAARPFWYSLPELPRTRLFWQKAFDVTFRHYWVEGGAYANQRFYSIVPVSAGLSEGYLIAFLNSAFVALWLEVQRAAMGEGAIEATVDEVKALPIVDPQELPACEVTEAEEAVAALGDREIGTVFQEYGAEEPERVRWDRMPEDRVRLERAVLGGILGLTEEQQLELIRALVDATQSRIARARSVRQVGEQRAGLREFAARIVEGLPLE